MIDGLEIDEVIKRIKHSSLSYNSRQLIYSRLINEIWNYNSHELKDHIGIDDAFDSVYLSSSDFTDENEDYVGC